MTTLRAERPYHASDHRVRAGRDRAGAGPLVSHARRQAGAQRLLRVSSSSRTSALLWTPGRPAHGLVGGVARGAHPLAARCRRALRRPGDPGLAARHRALRRQRGVRLRGADRAGRAGGAASSIPPSRSTCRSTTTGTIGSGPSPRCRPPSPTASRCCRSRYGTISRGHAWGGTLAASWRPARELLFRGSYTLLEMDVTLRDDAPAGSTPNVNPGFNPRHQAALRSSITLPARRRARCPPPLRRRASQPRHPGLSAGRRATRVGGSTRPLDWGWSDATSSRHGIPSSRACLSASSSDARSSRSNGGSDVGPRRRARAVRPGSSPARRRSARRAVAQAPPGALEYQVKAAYLLNFTRYVEWPPAALRWHRRHPQRVRGRSRSVRRGARSDDRRAGAPAGRPLRILRPDRPAGDVCHVAFIGETTRATREAWIAALEREPTLTVGEGADFARSGGMIGFVHPGRDGPVRDQRRGRPIGRAPDQLARAHARDAAVPERQGS